MPTGSIQGSVEVDGKREPDLTVTARDPETRSQFGPVTTNTEGKYRLEDIPVQAVEVRVEGIPGMDLPWRTIRVGSGANELALEIKTVTISVVGDNVRVEPNPLEIHPGTWVIWRRAPHGGDGPFTVHFAPISPMLRRRYEAEGAGQLIVGLVRYLILPGKYRYFVAVWDNGRILTEDPELIDENGDDRGAGGNG